jgi:glyoxylase-like metal-dependent hydrolase (beta-lactamase superfamily II)
MATTLPPEYEVYAVRYARRDANKNDHLIFKDPHDGPMPMDYFVWAIIGGGRTFVLDAGFTAEEAAKREREFIRLPADGLRMIGVEAERVEDLIVSHLHYDHIGTWDQFPRARFHLQDSEMRYATGRQMNQKLLRHSFNFADIEGMIRVLYDDRLSFVDGTAELAPGLSVHHIGGHTVGLQSVRVWTRRGWLVLASDASHYYLNMEGPAPYRTVNSVGDMLEGYRLLYRLADSPRHVIPGHDPLVMRRYPAASKETEGIAVRLDAEPLE